ncbi:MAG: META domain-containing protein [Gammaproteobacteria bacterium]|nr:META domain-containing protein [Gammaproteobacteria bacterium]
MGSPDASETLFSARDPDQPPGTLRGRWGVRAGRAACGLALWAFLGVAAAANITGQATYRERIALAPDATLEVILEDVSQAAGVRMADIRLTNPGPSPIAFTLRYDADQIDPTHRYVVRARILAGERLIFITEAASPVLTAGHGQEVALRLRQPPKNAPTALTIEQLPATFKGDLSCAGCAGVRYQLNLFPDHAYYLRQSWLGQTTTPSIDQLGRWEMDPERQTLRLIGDTELPILLAMSAPNRLRKLDRTGQALKSGSNEELQRTSEFEPFKLRGLLRGLYQVDGGQGVFTECLSGQRWTLLPNSEQHTLQLAYAALKLAPGQAVLASAEGEVSAGAVLRVIEYDGLWPAESCANGTAPQPLDNIYWKLTRLENQRLGASTGDEPHLVLQTSGELAGSSGCNDIVGRWVRRGNALSFTQTATTRRACATGMDIESALFKSLAATTTWAIEGQSLHLFNAEGRQLARFEAVYLR